ncbi:MAG TPA: transglycosylase domain-containing protein [Roseiflexaceae bacterium]|nr:transglycosylase domain-containing protein [Roseiflexaceae bacterium]
MRRSLSGRMLPRSRPLPHMLRPDNAPRGRLGGLLLRLMSALLLVITVVLISGVGAAYAGYAQLAGSLKDRITNIDGRTAFQTTRIYDRNNNLLYEFFGEGKRTRVPYSEISKHVIYGTIAIEDKTFFENEGVDYEGILKAFGRSVEAGEATGGASTITQQLIKRVVLTAEERAPEKTYERKVKEIVLAQEMSQRYSKEQILELYLNEIFYGNLSYGIEAASQSYFDVHAKDLTLAQASLLTGLPQQPTVYEPLNYLEGNLLPGVLLGENWYEEDYPLPDLAPPKWRQIAVLRQMVDEQYVTPEEGRRVIAEDLRFADQAVPLNAPHFVFYVRKLLEEQYGQDFANLGLTIKTTLDLDMQRMVQQTAAERIAELEERNIHNASVVVMQPNTGQILAMVGSIDYNKVEPSRTPGQRGNVLDGQVNVAVRERQPGSALKPFTFLAAMERGMTPASVIWDVPTKFLGGVEPYEPLNYNGRFNGPLRIRTALANSLNIPAVRALKFAGIDYTLGLLDRVGIKSGLKRGEGFYGLSLTLGGGEVTPLELTTAYNTLASGGRYYRPEAILQITDPSGKVIRSFTPGPGEQVLKETHVGIITDMLSDDTARQPIWGLNSKLKLSRPAAVKTGTTNDWRDAWAAGYTPYVTVGVWTGNNNNEPTAKVESLTGGGIIWHNVMEALFTNPKFQSILAEPYGGQVPVNFTVPKDLVRRQICALPGSFNNFREELFSPEMLAARTLTETDGLTPTPGQRRDSTRGRGDGCDAYTNVRVVRLGGGGGGEGDEQQASDSVQYCRPTEGMEVPEGRLTTIQIWKLPETDPSERVEYRWSGGGRGFAAAGARSIPACAPEQLAVYLPPPGSMRMPDLRRLGENQAKDLLAAMGIYNEIYVDYQDRGRVPDVFDQYVPYAVISTIPSAGQWVKPGDVIVLGVRAPEGAPPSVEQPPVEQPAAPEPQPVEQPPVEQPPVEQQPVEQQPVVPGPEQPAQP